MSSLSRLPARNPSHWQSLDIGTMVRHRVPRIAAVGLASWDRLIVVDRYPAPGRYAIVRQSVELPGGTTTNSAVTAARLGARVSVVALVGDDGPGRAIREALEREGISTAWLGTDPNCPTDAATVIISAEPPERTIFWHQGARLVRGSRLDITGIFEHDVVLLDVDDLALRRFLVDLPAHTVPSARLLGPLTYLADAGTPDALDLAVRHDVIVGNEREALTVTGQSTLDGAIDRLKEAMRGHTLRACLITRGSAGAIAFTETELWEASAYRVAVRDPTGAGDAFAGAVAFAMALHWAWPDALRFANAVAALSTRAVGAQTALPSFYEAVEILGYDPRSS
jgi:ribokinase